MPLYEIKGKCVVKQNILANSEVEAKDAFALTFSECIWQSDWEMEVLSEVVDPKEIEFNLYNIDIDVT